MSREAGSPGELVPGNRDRAKSQWAAGEAAAVLSFPSTLSSEESRDAPRLPAQLSVVSQHLSGTEPARTEVVCSPLA